MPVIMLHGPRRIPILDALGGLALCLLPVHVVDAHVRDGRSVTFVAVLLVAEAPIGSLFLVVVLAHVRLDQSTAPPRSRRSGVSTRRLICCIMRLSTCSLCSAISFTPFRACSCHWSLQRPQTDVAATITIKMPLAYRSPCTYRHIKRAMHTLTFPSFALRASTHVISYLATLAKPNVSVNHPLLPILRGHYPMPRHYRIDGKPLSWQKRHTYVSRQGVLILNCDGLYVATVGVHEHIAVRRIPYTFHERLHCAAYSELD